jgi:hypothetical protein
MKCKEHPRFTANRKPVRTQKHPDGCPTCWGVWEHAKTDPKRLAKTVTVELTLQQARVMVFALQSVGWVGGEHGRALQPLMVMLAQAVRDM